MYNYSIKIIHNHTTTINSITVPTVVVPVYLRGVCGEFSTRLVLVLGINFNTPSSEQLAGLMAPSHIDLKKFMI